MDLPIAVDDRTTALVRKNRISRRATVLMFFAVGLLGVSTLWISGFDPVRLWASRHSERNQLTPAQTSSRRVNGPVSVVQPQPTGNDLSISALPLPLVLAATRPGRNANEGYADLGVNAISSQTYRAGALLVNGARLAEIYRDYVVLERRGDKTRLYIEGRIPPGYTPALSTLATVGNQIHSAPAVASSRDDLTDFIRVSPIYKGDSLQALEVYSSTHASVFAQLGFEPGDQITAIDGEPVEDARSAFKALRRLSEGASLDVTVQRHGAMRILALNGSILMSSRLSANENQGISQ